MSKVLRDDTHRNTVSQEDLYRIMVWMDLNCMKLGSYSRDPDDLYVQEYGGRMVWPREIDPNNPTGIELDRPLLNTVTGFENRDIANAPSPSGTIFTFSGCGSPYRFPPTARIVRIYGVSGGLVREILTNGKETTWDGIDNRGGRVNPGIYIAQLY
jgi:hypothetical protein